MPTPSNQLLNRLPKPDEVRRRRACRDHRQLSPSALALFAGAEGGEGAGAVAFSAARQAAKQKVRCVLIDVGRVASEALGHERPGLGDLLAGDAAFGEVIQRDDTARVHSIPLGSLTRTPPMQRMRLVIGALTHTYDKVIVVADKLDDWPDEHVRPDIAAIVCGAGDDGVASHRALRLRAGARRAQRGDRALQRLRSRRRKKAPRPEPPPRSTISMNRHALIRAALEALSLDARAALAAARRRTRPALS